MLKQEYLGKKRTLISSRALIVLLIVFMAFSLSAYRCGTKTSVTIANSAYDPEDTETGATTTTLTPFKYWARTYDTEGPTTVKAVQQTNDKGFIAVGSTDINGSSIVVVKTKANGEVDWSGIYNVVGADQLIPGSDILVSLIDDPEEESYYWYSFTEGCDIKQTSDGGYAIFGRLYLIREDFDLDADFADILAADSDLEDLSDGEAARRRSRGLFVGMLLVKVNSDGDLEWSNCYHPKEIEDKNLVLSYSLDQTTDGGFIILGAPQQRRSNQKLWVLKLDADGAIGWQKMLELRKGDLHGSKVVKETPLAGGYIIATGVFGSGRPLELSETATSLTEYIYPAVDDENSEYETATYSANYSEAGGGPRPIYGCLLVKLDDQGKREWSQMYGMGEGHGKTQCLNPFIQEDPRGGYIMSFSVVGHRETDAGVLRLDSYGYPKWFRTFSQPRSVDTAAAIQSTLDGGYILEGTTIVDDECDYDLLVNIYGEDFVDLWYPTVDLDGNLVATDYTVESEDAFLAQIEELPLALNDMLDLCYSRRVFGDEDLFLLKLTAGGSLVWQNTYGGANDEFTYGRNYEFASNNSMVQENEDGSYILGGHAYSFTNYAPVMWLLKVRNNGEIGGTCDVIGSSAFVGEDGLYRLMTMEFEVKAKKLKCDTILGAEAPTIRPPANNDCFVDAVEVERTETVINVVTQCKEREENSYINR